MIKYAIKTFVKKVAVHHHYIIPGIRSYTSWVHLDPKAAPMKVSNEKFIALKVSKSYEDSISRKDDMLKQPGATRKMINRGFAGRIVEEI